MSDSDYSRKVCVIGAGSSGLTASKNFLRHGFDVDVLEREVDLGGNWNYGLPCSRVYRSTHMISSKAFTQLPDFPMPERFPEYPHHAQVLEYFRDYAAHFGLARHIQYRTPVERVEPKNDGRSWQVTVHNGETRRYAAVVIANGHHWSPRRPAYPGTFSGESLHSAEYKTPEIFAGKRVLIVGGGNSGCDIAVEAAQSATAVFHSTRRGYHYIPKFLVGVPADRAGDRLHKLRFPLAARRAVTSAILRLTVGRPEQFGLPKPDHKLFETHPIVNTLLPYFVGQGDIRPKPDVVQLDGGEVRFADGSSEQVDLIVYATGYDLVFPFIDASWLNWRDGRPRLFLNAFHPTYDSLFVAGMIQPDSGLFGIVHYQTELMALSLAAAQQNGQQAEWFRRLKSHSSTDTSGGIHYRKSARHDIEVEHWSYTKQLRKLIKRFSGKGNRLTAFR
jgi:hypothetical protein